MEKVQLNNLKHLKKIRKKLRNHSTPAERELWKYLKSRQLKETQFRRRHSMGNFVLNFYCREKKLGIELDGNYHYNKAQMKKDRKRTALLNAYGIRILKFSNQLVLENIEGVLNKIEACL